MTGRNDEMMDDDTESKPKLPVIMSLYSFKF